MQFSTTLPTLAGGVSQKAPESRSAARHAEQVNMVSDPVRGLVRRPGSLNKAYARVSPVPTAAADTDAFRAFDFRTLGADYAMVGRVKPTPSPNVGEFFAVNKETGAILPVTRQVSDPTLDAVLSAGVGAVAALGRFLVFAPNGGTATFSSVERWTPEANQRRHVVWVRGGAYSRTFRVAMIRGNQKFWVEYTTRQATYPQPLDTSDILPSDPEYTKKVNDRTNAYNSLALKWAGEALADATPESVVQRLAAELRLSGFLAPGATVEVIGTHLCITDPSIEEIEVDDSGDGNLMRSTGNTVGAPELLTPIAYPGKVVRVRPTNDASGLSFYLEAVAKDKSINRYTEVLWQECAGVRYDITRAFVFATVHNGAFYASSDLAWLGTQIGEAIPGYASNATGDRDTVPPPAFFTQAITALAVFQDRLLVMSSGAVSTSRPGDYLNFFRTSLVAVDGSDPLSFAIIGGEDDVIRHAALWDRNLFLTGDKRNYVIDGRRPLVPGGASATPTSDNPDTADTPPVPMGNFLFYARRGATSASVHQLRPGRALDTPLAEELSYELDTYLNGVPVELKVNPTPGFLFLRTTDKDKLFIYQFSDTEDGRRVTDAWHTWTFAGGTLMAVIPHAGNLLVVHRRVAHNGAYAVVDQLPLDAGAWRLPYMDSLVPGNAKALYAHPQASTAYYADDETLEGRSALPPLPDIDFTTSPAVVTPGNPVTFSGVDLGAPASAPIVSWQWDFGDGSPIATGQVVAHPYSTGGPFTVLLTVIDNLGRIVARQRTGFNPALFPSFTKSASSGFVDTANLSVAFTDTSTGPVTSWLWNFGDGTTSTLQNPTKVYDKAGTYSVTLQVNGLATSDPQTVVVTFRETFDHNDIALYPDIFDPANAFTIVNDTYGPALRVASSTIGGASGPRVMRTLGASQTFTEYVEFLTKLETLEIDDSAYIQFGDNYFVAPRREQFFDPLSRLRWALPGAPTRTLGPTLAAGVWYRIRLTLGATPTLTIRNAGTNALVATDTWPVPVTSLPVGTILVGTDSGLVTSPTTPTLFDSFEAR